jgi:hypothetical protein
MAEEIQFPQSQGAVLTPSTLVSAALPEEWGGRPQGESRRAIRMREEWDKRRETMLEEQQAMQQMDVQRRQLALQERDQFIQDSEFGRKLKEYEAQQDIQGQAEIESNNILDWLGGRAVDETGQRIPKPDPKTQEFQTEFLRRLAENPLGAELNKGIVDQYMGANKTYLDAQQMAQKEEGVIRREERAIERQLGAEERLKERQIEAEERAEERQEERGIVSQEREIDKSIRSERQKLIQFQNQKVQPKEDIEATQNKIIDLRIEKAALRGLVFESEEDAEKANPPSGSIIYIGRKPFKVP